jgi:hypothetical protein
MRTILALIICLVLVLPFASCEKEYFKPLPVDPNAPIGFVTDIEPMLQSNCAVSGCHNGAISPNLSIDKSYAALMEGGYLDTLKPAESLLMIKLNTNMPPQKMPASEINKVLTWITQGAKEQ